MARNTTTGNTPVHYEYTMKTRQSPAGPPHPNSHHSHNQPTRGNSKPSTPASPRQGRSTALSPGRNGEARASSPNYFGLAIDSATESRTSSGGQRHDWTPSSSIKSFGAAIPQQQVPLDANPEFEAFRKQVDFNRGKSFALSTSHYAQPSFHPTPVRPKPPKRHTHASDTGSFLKARSGSRMDIDSEKESLNDSAYVSAESKRNSEISLQLPQLSNAPRFESPSLMDGSVDRTELTRSEDRDPRLSMMEHRPPPARGPARKGPGMPHASTISNHGDRPDQDMITGDYLEKLMATMDNDKLLILDIRSSQNFAMSRIDGALNLCIPTTLLKRPNYNIAKLQQTFQSGPQAERFAKWSEMECLVVYDSHANDKRDAIAAQNMIKKFTNEGYNKPAYILRGGFSMFKDSHPHLVDSQNAVQSTGQSQRPGPAGNLAPVIGGVSLPSTANQPNPFFSNVRQNQDLVDGVGQLDVARPDGLQSPTLPRWLRDASSQSNHGKQVSDKFLKIEQEEKDRMHAAYSAFNPKNQAPQNTVEISGVEKGGKNRYKDILPFEHTRVRVEEGSDAHCDYVNASHIKASRSHKRYIASQGPLPATFEDFWSVVWEQDVRVVLMLTAESEGGHLKCHSYWKSGSFGSIKLKQISEAKASLDIDKYRSYSNATPATYDSAAGRKRAQTTATMGATTPAAAQPSSAPEAPFVTIRKFSLSHSAHPFAPIREITHLHFAQWPDFGSPAQPSHLLALVDMANRHQRAAMPVHTDSIVHSPAVEGLQTSDEPEEDSNNRPMLVHCSAGCGRTGTFCTVDSVIDMLKRERRARNTGHKAIKRDHDGDVTMAMDEAVSPRSKTFNFNVSNGNGHHSAADTQKNRRSSASSPLDTSWMHDDSVDLIQRTVEDFRGQRISMVQSLRQYVLCYETVLEWITRVNERQERPAGRIRSGSMLER